MNRFPTTTVLIQALLLGLLSALLVNSAENQKTVRALHASRLALDSKAYSLAADSFSQVVLYSPWRIDLLLQAGRSALQAGDPEAAITYFSQYSVAGNLPPDCLIILGDAYLAYGDTEQAVQTWQQVSITSGYQELILLRLLEVHRANDDYTSVLEDLKSLLRLHPENANYYYQAGLLMAVLDPDAALAYLSQAATNDSNLSSQATALITRINTARLYDEPAYISVSVGRWLGSVDEWRLALLAFQRAVDQRPDYAEAWAYLGEALQQTYPDLELPDNQIGLNELQTALQIDANSITANVLMSLYWQRHGDEETALEYLNIASTLEPDNPFLQVELGRLTASMSDLPSAQSHYENAVALAPSDPLLWRLLAEFSLDKQIQVRQIALPAARNMVLLAPHDPQSLDLLGRTFLTLGDLLNAERFLRQAINRDINYAPAHLHLGIVYLNQGQIVLAQYEFRTAELLEPDSLMKEQIKRLNSYYFP